MVRNRMAAGLDGFDAPENQGNLSIFPKGHDPRVSFDPLGFDWLPSKKLKIF